MSRDHLRPMPMTAAEVADLIERTRSSMTNRSRTICSACYRQSGRAAARLRRWRAKMAAKA